MPDIDAAFDIELALEFDPLVGVGGGVIAPLSCNIFKSLPPMVLARVLVGESGGVDTVLKGSGLENLLPDADVLFLEPKPGIVVEGVCKWSFGVEHSGPRYCCWGKMKCGKVAIIALTCDVVAVSMTRDGSGWRTVKKGDAEAERRVV